MNAYKIFITLIILASLASNIILFYENRLSLFMIYSGNDSVSKFEKRIECLKGLVPKSGLAGYVSDRPPIEFLYTAYTLLPLFVEVKQYSYAPHFVEDKGKDYGFVIENTGNERNSTFKNDLYEVIIDCSNGVRLYKKKD